MCRYNAFFAMAIAIVWLSGPTYAVVDDFQDGDYTNNPTWVIGNPGYTWASVQSDPVRPDNRALRIHGTDQAHGVLETLVDAPYRGFDASMEYLAATASSGHPVLWVTNGPVNMIVYYWSESATLSLEEYVDGTEHWHNAVGGSLSANTWYKIHMWHDRSNNLVRGEIRSLGDGALLAELSFTPITDLLIQPPITKVRIGAEETAWQYFDNVSLTSGPANAAPTANAGADLGINSADQSLTTIQGTGSDPDDDALQYRWLEGGVELAAWAAVVGGATPLNLGALPAFSLGDHVLALEVSDGTATGSDTMTLTVLNTPPVAVLNPASLTIEIAAAFTIKATAADFDGDVLVYQWVKGSEVLASGSIDAPDDGSPISVPDLAIGAGDPQFGLGTHTIDLVVDDPANGPVTVTATVVVQDSTLPSLSPVSSESILWPPDHTLRPITITAHAADNGGTVALTTTVQSNEPQEDGGDGSTDQDWTTPVINDLPGTIDLSLRAERSGGGGGRIYTITITATDQSGNVSVAVVEVRVPHDRKNK